MRNIPERRARITRMAAFGSLVLGLPGCVSLAPSPTGLAAPSPTFSPERFFEGGTEGIGTLRIVAHRRRAVHVLGIGQIAADGSLALSQAVAEGDEPPVERRWNIRQVAPGRFAGTLSDAVGPVAGEVTGNMLHLRFRMRGGLAVEQRLYLEPDGRVALNRMTVRKLGIVVAVLEETIRKT